MTAEQLHVPRGARVVVVGGANTDYVGMPAERLIARVSNPGAIRTSAGGVGRNIAENLARLGVEVDLITAFGDDESGRELAASCREVGIGIEGSLFSEGLAGARYVAVNDENHDLSVAVSDMRVLDGLTPDVLASPSRARLIAAADVVVADTNLAADSLVWLAENTGAPLVIDPVSASKAVRVAPLMASIAAIKPNAHEAKALLGMAVRDLDDAEEAAREFVRRGVATAFVTPGALGVAWADSAASGAIESPRLNPVNASGAGDAFAAGIVYGILARAETEVSARFASALSMVALDSYETVNPELSRERVLALMTRVYG